MNSDIWENQYVKFGFKAQRLYPNEELLRFLGRYYFHLSRADRKKIRILEVGAGSGANLWMMAKEGFNVFGMDISKEGLKLCAKMLKYWSVIADLKVGDMTVLPYKDNYFDAVIDVVSMQHLTFTDHIKAYSEIKRVLKPGSRMFSYHLGNKSFSFKYGQGKLIDKFTIDNVNNMDAPLADNGITCFPNEKEIELVLNKLGFNDIDIENVVKTYRNRLIKIQYLIICARI